MSNLKELSSLTRNLTILYVEDSKHLLKQMSLYLEKLFKKVYKAEDGIEGLDLYKEITPDIVLTDLTMPNMDGFEMIKVLKQINPNVKIIIISAHIDTGNLLEAIHIGVSDFIPKPIDRVLLGNALYKIAINLSNNNKILNKEKLSEESNLVKKLEILSQSNPIVELINHYKGVPIIHEGTIVSIDESTIILHAPYIQTLAINYEKHTAIETPFLDFAIEATLEKINHDTREIRLTNINKSKYSGKIREQIRIQPDDNFKAIVHFKNNKIDVKVTDVSIKSISLNIKQNDFNLQEGDSLDIKLGFIAHHKGGNILFKDNIIISIKSKVFKKYSKNNSAEIVLLYDLNKHDLEKLSKYIFERELELIKEFKQFKLEL